VILVYAGRRARSLTGNLETVQRRIARCLQQERPDLLIGGAADGADLVVLETALAMPNGPSVHVILPTEIATFRHDSVDPEHQARFDALFAEIERRGMRLESLRLDPGSQAYRAANQAFLDAALAHAVGADAVRVLLVAKAGEGQIVEDLLERATLRGIPILRIDPHADGPAPDPS